MNTPKRSISKTVAAFLLSALFTNAFAAGKSIQETFSWKYTISKDAGVTMENYNCNLSIHTWDKGETELRLTIDAETNSDEDAAALEKYLREMVFSNSPSSVIFNSAFWESRNTVRNRTTMKLRNGKTISLRTFTMKGELWIPSGCRFELASKYSQCTMEDFAGPLKLDFYNGSFTGGKISANVDITDKYSTIETGDTKNIRANLYNSKLVAGNTGSLNIDSKYSKVNFTSCGNLTANSYNDKFEIPKTGDVIFVAKYSDLRTERSENVRIDSYDGTVDIKDAGNIEITSKYTEFIFSAAGRCKVSSSYNDKLTAGKLTSLFVGQSKYTTFRIDNIIESIEEKDGYNDSFTASFTGGEFNGVTLNGKYIKASLTLPGNASYRFKANLKYPDFDIDESAFKPVTKIVDGAEVKYDAIKGTESGNMPVIEVTGYQVSLKISEK